APIGGRGCGRGPFAAANPSGRGDGGGVCKGIGVGSGPPDTEMVPKQGPVASGMRDHGAGVGQGLGAESAGRGVEDPDVGGGEHRAGGASAGWAERGGILGGRPSKRLWGYKLMVGLPGFHVHSPTPDMALGQASSSPEPSLLITEVFLCKRVEVLTAALSAWEGELQWANED
ncbi:hypothetical protein C0989_007987, partial [Termitomyces sp. Mn162]